jgi:hypothetical protein
VGYLCLELARGLWDLLYGVGHPVLGTNHECDVNFLNFVCIFHNVDNVLS